jgi:hypothetical protein
VFSPFACLAGKKNNFIGSKWMNTLLGISSSFHLLVVGCDSSPLPNVRTIAFRFPTMRALLIAAFVLAAFAPSVMAAGKGCHNITGTCLDHGFVCANEEVIPHAQRCNGVEDCADGTDEFMCQHEDDSPLHLRAPEARHAAEQASCIACTCTASVLLIASGNAWFTYAKQAPTDFIGLMTGTGTYAGRPCNSACAFSITMGFYKKTGVCRGWLCCARQRWCNTCSASCCGATAATRCYLTC